MQYYNLEVHLVFPALLRADRHGYDNEPILEPLVVNAPIRIYVKGKGKFHPITGHEGPVGE